MKAERQHKEPQQATSIQSKREKAKLGFVDNRSQIITQMKLIKLIQKKKNKNILSNGLECIYQFSFGSDGKFPLIPGKKQSKTDRGNPQIMYKNAGKGPSRTLNDPPNTTTKTYWNNTINATYHHVIPVQLLRDFWNVLIDLKHFGYLSDIAYNVTAGHLHKRQDQTANRDNALREGASIVYGEKELRTDQEIKDATVQIASGKFPEDEEVRSILTTAYLWLPGNIVLGPETNRKDDDKKGMNIDREVAGASGAVLTINEFEELFNEIKSYVFDGVEAEKGLGWIASKIKLLASATVRKPRWFARGVGKWEMELL